MEKEIKQHMYRVKTVEELKQLDVREVAKYLRSRQRRTVLRQFQKIEIFLNRAKKKIEAKKRIKTHDRSLVVMPQMVGMKIQVYNGKDYVPFEVTHQMIGHCFGEFSSTRKKAGHTITKPGGTKKKKK